MTPKAIKEKRTRLGLSQEALAAKLGVSVTTVSRWEHGRAMPHAVFRRAIEAL